MTGPELFSIIGSVVGVGLALAVLILRATSRIDSDCRAADARADKDRTEAAADRRAFQVAMDDFRKEMQRLAERQSRLEGAAGD